MSIDSHLSGTLNKLDGLLKNNKSKTIISILVVLVFSALFDSAFGHSIKPGYVLAVFIFLLWISRYSLVFSLLVVVCAVVSAMYYPIGIMYGSPNINIFISIFNTNINESADFLNNIPVLYIIPSLALVTIAALTLKSRKYIPNIKSVVLILTFLLLVLFHPIKAYLTTNSITPESVRFTPFRFANEVYQSYKTVMESEAKIKQLMAQPSTWSPSLSTSDYDTYIIVIGESVRRDFMHAYGFSIANTPFSSTANGLFFQNYISAAGSTQASVSGSLVMSHNGEQQNNNNIINLAKKQGLSVYWISNQGSLGNSDFGVSQIGKQADNVTFLKKGDYDSRPFSDGDLLPHFQQAIAETSSAKKLIILHLMGSHSDFCSRVNDQYDEFFINKKLSCYVQSIKNTDNLLAELAQSASGNHKKWTMIYFSDHGLSSMHQENGRVANLQHGDRSKQNFQVPFFITSYDAKQRKEIHHYRSGLDFLQLYTQWTGSKEPLLSEACDLLSDVNCHKKIQVINFDDKLVDYDSLEDLPLTL
ncbi:phosphoethanolamine transferase [Pragia fontium]|uniref:phosphoethanolamine transferase n=1 Tax=Pragia fontium TaxID=82985 RepID=UPI00069C008F|nr:phosphoethanolamine transferase [Pragia fontium]